MEAEIFWLSEANISEPEAERNTKEKINCMSKRKCIARTISFIVF